jgi:hypothetical protein
MNSPDAYERWLRRRSLAGGLSSLAGAPVLIALGAGAAVLMYWVLLAVTVVVAFNCGASMSKDTIRLVAAILVGAVFADYVRRQSRGIMEYSFSAEPGGQSFLLRYRGRGAFGMLYPGGAQNVVTFVLGLLYTGPWLVTAGVRLAIKGVRLLALDVAGCAAVIALLHQRGRRVPYEEIARELPRLDFRRVFRHLRAVDGVLFLREEPPGLALNTDLILAVDRALAVR